MRLLDDQGKVFGKLNTFDLFIAVVVVTVAALLYRWLAAPYRVAPPYALDENQVSVHADLQLPPGQRWMCDQVKVGAVEVDPRTGAPRAEVTGCAVEEDSAVITLTVHAIRDGQGRLLFEGEPLVPGRTLQLETEVAILEGVVRKIQAESP